jgi:hypothetical protein
MVLSFTRGDVIVKCKRMEVDLRFSGGLDISVVWSEQNASCPWQGGLKENEGTVTWSIKHSLRLLSHAGPSCHKIYHAYERTDIQEYKDRKINFLKVLQESPLCGAHFLQTDKTQLQPTSERLMRGIGWIALFLTNRWGVWCIYTIRKVVNSMKDEQRFQSIV